jgi:hypothetical protein
VPRTTFPELVENPCTNVPRTTFPELVENPCTNVPRTTSQDPVDLILEVTHSRRKLAVLPAELPKRLVTWHVITTRTHGVEEDAIPWTTLVNVDVRRWTLPDTKPEMHMKTLVTKPEMPLGRLKICTRTRRTVLRTWWSPPRTP